METKTSKLNIAMGRQLKGARIAAELSVPELAKLTGLSKGVIDRMTASDIRDINITQIDLIARAAGLSAHELVRRAVEQAEAMARAEAMSAGASTTTSLDTKREEKARAMSTEQLEELDAAATRDPNYDAPESEAP